MKSTLIMLWKRHSIDRLTLGSSSYGPDALKPYIPTLFAPYRGAAHLPIYVLTAQWNDGSVLQKSK